MLHRFAGTGPEFQEVQEIFEGLLQLADLRIRGGQAAMTQAFL